MNDAHLDALVAQLGQRIGQHLGRALHVRLDDDGQLLDAAFGDLLLQRFERETAALRAERFVLGLHLTVLRDLSRLGRIRERLKGVARLWQPAEAQHFHRCRGRRGLDGLAPVVD